MLSPKMQKSVRMNDSQLAMLAEKARYDQSLSGYLHKRSADLAKWQLRWFVLYQNLLFYYENENCSRPSGVILLESSYCDRVVTVKSKEPDKQHCFVISYRRENQRQYELKAATESDCKMWIDAIREASFNKLRLQKEELEQKHLHLLQIVESEKTAKWQYTQQCEELMSEIKKLRAELCALKKELRPVASSYTRKPKVQRTMSQGTGSLYMSGSLYGSDEHDSVVTSFGLRNITEAEVQKIKKVQSFLRGWLCRRRWKQIVEQYIKSPHAESMRKRNSLVFQMVETEEEYTEQMEILVSCFLRPFKMAASSKKPPCNHEDVNSIFLNSETVLFLHQIFLKGLISRMENWPTLVLGDLFDMLLPMLSIYQEYVRNHHYSLQVLTECKQLSPAFAAMLIRLENKVACGGRSLETFLTYPMHQIPRYIITLHELLAHTPHDHVERKSLENARQQLEHLSRQMHDEVSETENLRKNLAVERMIVEGCDILLDVNQVFVRQGTLIQILDKPRGARSRFSATFGGKSSDKEAVRQCFLFSKHLLLTTRQSGDDGRLNLVSQIGKIPLSDAVLVEDPNEQNIADDDELSMCSISSGVSESSGIGSGSVNTQLQNRDFKIIFDVKSGGPQFTVHLVAPTIQEKAAWISDISHCMDNVHLNDLLQGLWSDTSSVTMPEAIENDPKLFNDDVDIKFSKTLNSCKIPQVRLATPERLLQRLMDLRFLSIDYLNTFLITYRVFIDSVTVLETLKKALYEAEPPDAEMPTGSLVSLDVLGGNTADSQLQIDDKKRSILLPRKTSGASSVSGYGSEISESHETKSHGSVDSSSGGHILNSKGYWRSGGYKKVDEEQQLSLISEAPSIMKRSPTIQSCTASIGSQSPALPRKISIYVDKEKKEENDGRHLTVPKVIAVSSSSETLTDNTIMSAPSSPSNLSSVTLVGSTGSGLDRSPQDSTYRSVSKETDTRVATDLPKEDGQFTYEHLETEAEEKTPTESPTTSKPAEIIESKTSKEEKQKEPESDNSSVQTPQKSTQNQQNQQNQQRYQHRASIVSAPAATARSSSISTITGNYWASRRSIQENQLSFQQGTFQHEQISSKAGVVITSSRQSHRSVGPVSIWSSTSTAATAFAIATSASSNPPDIDKDNRSGSYYDKNSRKESVMSTATMMRVLKVLRHWISKHPQDFESDQRLKHLTIKFLEDIIRSPNLLPAEYKAANQLLRLIAKEVPDSNKVELEKLLVPPTLKIKQSIETFSSVEVAEQMTYLDHKIFMALSSKEFLGQAWIKPDKVTRAPNICLLTKRFNEMSQLVASEIVRRKSISARTAMIEKWVAIADYNRTLHNFNGVLQICAAFSNSCVFRLKKTWDKVPKATIQMMERLQNIVSSDGRFKNLREALRRCDPPCIPYIGMYLSDLSFIEEGTPTVTEDGLLNFSKMRMIAHVIQEIYQLQQGSYNIEPVMKVLNYLLDPSLQIDDDTLYRMSLEIEPRSSKLSSSSLLHLTPSVAQKSKK